MFVLNSTSSKFLIGKSVIITKSYTNGQIKLQTGDKGLVVGAHLMSLPDMGLFNIRIIEVIFGIKTVNLSDSIAEEYMEIV